MRAATSSALNMHASKAQVTPGSSQHQPTARDRTDVVPSPTSSYPGSEDDTDGWYPGRPASPLVPRPDSPGATDLLSNSSNSQFKSGSTSAAAATTRGLRAPYDGGRSRSSSSEGAGLITPLGRVLKVLRRRRTGGGDDDDDEVDAFEEEKCCVWERRGARG